MFNLHNIVELYIFILGCRLMQEGSPRVLVDLQTSAQLYNNLYLGWTKHSDRAPEMSPLLAIYALCVSFTVIVIIVLYQLIKRGGI